MQPKYRNSGCKLETRTKQQELLGLEHYTAPNPNPDPAPTVKYVKQIFELGALTRSADEERGTHEKRREAKRGGERGNRWSMGADGVAIGHALASRPGQCA